MVTRIGESVPEGFKVVSSLGKLIRNQPRRIANGMAEHLLQLRIFEPLPKKMSYDESLDATIHVRRSQPRHVASHCG